MVNLLGVSSSTATVSVNWNDPCVAFLLTHENEVKNYIRKVVNAGSVQQVSPDDFYHDTLISLASKEYKEADYPGMTPEKRVFGFIKNTLQKKGPSYKLKKSDGTEETLYYQNVPILTSEVDEDSHEIGVNIQVLADTRAVVDFEEVGAWEQVRNEISMFYSMNKSILEHLRDSVFCDEETSVIRCTTMKKNGMNIRMMSYLRDNNVCEEYTHMVTMCAEDRDRFKEILDMFV